MRKLAIPLSLIAMLAAAMALGGSWRPLSKPAPAGPYETATLTGGCFWSLQEKLRDIPGVIKTTVGYTGGTVANPTHDLVAAGKTGHAEAVEVIFDPAKLSYEQLLTNFLLLRDPTRVPSSPASSSRSGIFYHSETQKQTALRVKEKINESGKWTSPVVTEITSASAFYAAEEYHQDYYRKSPEARSCSLF